MIAPVMTSAGVFVPLGVDGTAGVEEAEAVIEVVVVVKTVEVMMAEAEGAMTVLVLHFSH